MAGIYKGADRASANWRGTVGIVKLTYESGSMVEFIRVLPLQAAEKTICIVAA